MTEYIIDGGFEDEPITDDWVEGENYAHGVGAARTGDYGLYLGSAGYSSIKQKYTSETAPPSNGTLTLYIKAECTPQTVYVEVECTQCGIWGMVRDTKYTDSFSTTTNWVQHTVEGLPADEKISYIRLYDQQSGNNIYIDDVSLVD